MDIKENKDKQELEINHEKQPSNKAEAAKAFAGSTINKVVDDIDSGDYNKDIVDVISDTSWNEFLGDSALAAFESLPWDSALDEFARAALGSVPWVGGFVNAAASIRANRNTRKALNSQTTWLSIHQDKLKELYKTMEKFSSKLQEVSDSVDDKVRNEIEERLQSKGFIDIVSKSFRVWDAADTDDKRKLIANLLANSTYTRICSDDVVRLFIDWLNTYHESHFYVINTIYGANIDGVTRYDIWCKVWGEDIPDQGSPESDLFSMLIRDLSTGGVIRQQKEVDFRGKSKTKSISGVKERNVKDTAFDDTKPYELTALGKQFVHYTMQDSILKLAKNNK